MLRISWVEGLGFRVIDEVFFLGGGAGVRMSFLKELATRVTRISQDVIYRIPLVSWQLQRAFHT